MAAAYGEPVPCCGPAVGGPLPTTLPAPAWPQHIKYIYLTYICINFNIIFNLRIHGALLLQPMANPPHAAQHSPGGG